MKKISEVIDLPIEKGVLPLSRFEQEKVKGGVKKKIKLVTDGQSTQP